MTPNPPQADLAKPHGRASNDAKSDALWPWVVATGIWVAMGSVLLFYRWPEVSPLLEPASTSGASGATRLPLNSIGDILAGFFAPLAFLWLFVATMLQRRELRLQREELADTRQVLADQREELARSASENNRQTAIMQRTLDVSRAREAYDEFGLRLYYFARTHVSKFKLQLGFRLEENPNVKQGSHLISSYKNFDFSQAEPATIDLFFDTLLLNLDNFYISTGDQVSMPIAWSSNQAIKETFQSTKNLIALARNPDQY